MTEERLHFGNFSDLEIFRPNFRINCVVIAKLANRDDGSLFALNFVQLEGKPRSITLVQYLSKSTALKSQEVKECYSTKVSY